MNLKLIEPSSIQLSFSFRIPFTFRRNTSKSKLCRCSSAHRHPALELHVGGTDTDKKEQPIPTVNKQPSIPEDGYEWNKYGQKYIKNIRKIRSYYRCRRKECNARKRLEWSPANPTILRVIYDGMHDHRSPSDAEQVHSVDVNQYELGNQVLGQLNDTQQV
uniref:WRKY domain-containing protein n=1 Tax=Musa acuminata subsp. malaccensis TaxID=214687 RepID=A0A804JR08_MUSAM